MRWSCCIGEHLPAQLQAELFGGRVVCGPFPLSVVRLVFCLRARCAWARLSALGHASLWLSMG
jgi:hypothetical protein